MELGSDPTMSQTSATGSLQTSVAHIDFARRFADLLDDEKTGRILAHDMDEQFRREWIGR